LLARSATTDRIFELAGPTAYTLRDLATFTLGLIGRRRPLMPVPLAAAEALARLFEVLPNPPLTTGQVDLLKADNLASGGLPGFRELDIQPQTIEAVVPTYIGRSRAAQVD
jgi:NADH dehydrogenase